MRNVIKPRRSMSPICLLMRLRTGMRLEAILRDYMSRLEASQHTGEEVKPMNLIVVTDGGKSLLKSNILCPSS